VINSIGRQPQSLTQQPQDEQYKVKEIVAISDMGLQNEPRQVKEIVAISGMGLPLRQLEQKQVDDMNDFF
jgi:hypothetical protein